MIKRKLWTSLVAFLSGLILVSALVPKAVSNSQGSSQLYLPVLFRPPPETWIHIIGSEEEERGKAVLAAPDGGAYLLVEQGTGSDVSYLVIKLTPALTIEWQKTFTHGTSSSELNGSLTADGGLVLSGLDAVGGGAGAQVIKLNSDGTIAWQKNYGGPMLDYATAIQQTTDGGYIFTGYTASNAAAINDMYIVKLDQNGGVQWQKSYAAGLYNYGTDIQQTSDGGYIVVGSTGDPNYVYNLWALKLDSSGAVVWQKALGGSNQEFGHAVTEAANGDFLFAGSTASAGEGENDALLIRLNADGDIIWQKSYGGGFDNQFYDIYPTVDGRFAVAGETIASTGGRTSAWMLLLDGNGSMIWQKRSNGYLSESARTIQQLPDGKFLIGGSTESNSHGGSDAWVIKLNTDGVVGNPFCGQILPYSTFSANTTFTDQGTSIVTVTSPNTTTNTTHTVSSSNLQLFVRC